MRIAIIGTGNIGGTLGSAFAGAGHDVVFGAREPSGTEAPAPVTGIADALRKAEVVVLAVPGPAVRGLVEEHAGALDGRLVVDATNTIGGGGPANSHDVITAAAPAARYVRAFNTLGWENFREPRFGGETADLFYSSGEAERELVDDLIGAVGLRPVWVGADAHDAVDGLLPLWFVLSKRHGRHLAFKLLTDERR
ncbi:MAG TPA: NAD(P)-binding domain-containing protein [Acidimicrobiales bacterium]|nr:NAD(P)-binding domain-containing protein [Acidimicrobiales bacterium]